MLELAPRSVTQVRNEVVEFRECHDHLVQNRVSDLRKGEFRHIDFSSRQVPGTSGGFGFQHVNTQVHNEPVRLDGGLFDLSEFFGGEVGDLVHDVFIPQRVLNVKGVLGPL